MKKFLSSIVLAVLVLCFLITGPTFAQTHFVPCYYPGSPFQPMNIYIVEAKLDGENLNSGDEIGIFDGVQCVGAGVIGATPPSTQSPLLLVASKDDGYGCGFSDGNPIIFKIWDGSNEYNATPQFLHCSTGEPIPPPPFEGLGSACVKLNATTLEWFIPVWFGNNAFMPMSIYVTKAQLNDVDLIAGDEIGIFDGELCVGAVKLKAPASMENIVNIICSKDDGSGNGFTNGHSITIKVWDQSVGGDEGEDGSRVYYFDCSSGNPIAPVPFVELGSACVEIDAPGVVTQSISLSTGWNMFSLAVETEESHNMLDILAPILDVAVIKVIDEKGNTVEKLFGSWQNYIGDWQPTEGYYIKVSQDVVWEITGMELDTPLPIPLLAGWNMISYPCFESVQNALTIVQPLIDDGYLIKVIDEAGNTIEQLFGTWQNYIGNMMPGEGYYIKVNANCSLAMTCGGSFMLSKQTEKVKNSVPEHFSVNWKGHPYKPMSLYVVAARVDEMSLAIGDEIGIFDGEECVGVGVWSGTVSASQPLLITVGKDDGSGTGFKEGHQIGIRLWRRSSGEEISLAKGSVSYFDMKKDNWTSHMGFEDLGSAALSITVSEGSFKEVIELPKDYHLYQNHPNPFNPSTKISYDLLEDTDVRLEIYDINGNRVKLLYGGRQSAGHHAVEWNGTDEIGNKIVSGVYLYRLSCKGYVESRKMIFVK